MRIRRVEIAAEPTKPGVENNRQNTSNTREMIQHSAEVSQAQLITQK